MSKLSDAKKLTLGADPEFCFVKRGRIYSAENLLSNEPGEDEFIDTEGEFGLDGCGEIAELRPKPSNDPYVLVENIRKALGIGYIKIPNLRNYKWVATPIQDDYSMGGHIHLGFRNLPKGVFVPRINNRVMTQLLDLYLGVPGVLVEPEWEANSRRDEYGGVGDYRRQPWGMEYRVLSTWLSHPAVALSILCLAKTVAVEGLMHGDTLRAISDKEYSSLHEFGFDPKLMKTKLLPTVYSRLTKFELYPLYKEEIGFLLDMIYAGKSTLTRPDMKTTWDLDKLLPKVVASTPKKLSQLFSSNGVRMTSSQNLGSDWTAS